MTPITDPTGNSSTGFQRYSEFLDDVKEFVSAAMDPLTPSGPLLIYVSPRPAAGEMIKKIMAQKNGVVLKTESLAQTVSFLTEGIKPDIIVIDAPNLFSVTDSSIFDVVNLLRTLPKVKGSSKPCRLFVGLEPDADVDVIKEIVNLDIDGIFPQSERFSFSEKKQAIEDALAGIKHIPAHFAEKIKEQRRKSKKECAIVLTPRQTQILDLVTTRGASNKIIAKTLKISESTVKLHMSAILKKYGCRNRTQLAVFSQRTRIKDHTTA